MAKAAKKKVKKQSRAEMRAARRAAAQALRVQVQASFGGSAKPVKTRAITDQDVEDIIAAVADGLTVTAKCRQLGISNGQFTSRLASGPEERAKRYVQARSLQAEAWADEIADIADEEINYAGEPGAANAEVAHRNLRVNTRKWLMGKYNIKFADKAGPGDDAPRSVTYNTVNQVYVALKEKGIDVEKLPLQLPNVDYSPAEIPGRDDPVSEQLSRALEE